MNIIKVFFFFILGSVLGSFFNVVIYRLPQGKSIISPSSHCPVCGAKLKVWHNIPIVSYILLKGRCYYCKEKISLRYPIVEATTGILLVLIFLKTGLNLKLLWAAVFLLSLVPVFFIDLDHQIIPDVFSLGGIVWGIFMSLVNLSYIPLKEAILGAVVCGGIFLVVHIASKGGMGLGDVKLAAAFGANFGWKLGIVSLFLSVLFGAVIGITLIATGKKKRKDKIPFGPFMVMAAYATFFFGKTLLKWYMG